MMMKASTPRGGGDRFLLPRHGRVTAFSVATIAIVLSLSTTTVSAWTIAPSLAAPKSLSPSTFVVNGQPKPISCQRQSKRVSWHVDSNALSSRYDTTLSATKIPGDDGVNAPVASSTTTSTLSILAMKLYAGVAIFYWYWLVLGAVGQANGWPGIPHWLPSTPTFPPSDAELQSVLDDSYHFLYLSDALNDDPTNMPIVPAWRLAFFNTVEAWIVAFLPLLWKDQRRWPRAILLGYWSVGCVFLTNAFLAPYLLITEFTTPTSLTLPAVRPGKNRMVSGAFAGFSSAVVLYGLSTIMENANVVTSLQSAVSSWWEAAQVDRSALAYGADLVILSFFQPMLLGRVRNDLGQLQPVSDFIPFFGLISWLLLEKDDGEDDVATTAK